MRIALAIVPILLLGACQVSKDENNGTTSVTYDHCAYRAEDDAVMATAKQTLVLIDVARRQPLPVPDTFRQQITAFER